MNLRSFWIRKDRNNYFLGGVIIACTVGAFVSAYWHFTDRISVRQNIKIRSKLKKEDEAKKLREVQYTPSKLKVGGKQYYKMDDETIPSVPKLDEDDEN